MTADPTPPAEPEPTLAEFLLARYRDEEQEARAATPGPWVDIPMGSEGSIVRAGGNTIHTARKPATCREFADAAHIARHDPARVLADLDAKRRIVEDAQRVEQNCVAYLRSGKPEPEFLTVQISTVRRYLAWLALPYADHPDYRAEWKP